MANVNAPFGLRPIGLNNAVATPSFSLNGLRKFASNNTTATYRGDAVQSLASGYVSTITAASVGASQWAGVFWGCEYLSLSQGRRVVSTYWPGGDNNGVVDVLMVPLATSGIPQQFLIQATSTPFTIADVGANCDIAYSAGTAFTGYSKSAMTLDRSTIGTTATLPFRVVGLYSDIAPSGAPGSDNTTDYNIVIVAFNAGQETGIHT